MTPRQSGHPFPRKLMTVSAAVREGAPRDRPQSRNNQSLFQSLSYLVTQSITIISIPNSGKMSTEPLSRKTWNPPTGRECARVHVSDEVTQPFLTWRLPWESFLALEWRGGEKPRRGDSYHRQEEEEERVETFTLALTLR